MIIWLLPVFFTVLSVLMKRVRKDSFGSGMLEQVGDNIYCGTKYVRHIHGYGAHIFHVSYEYI